MHGFHLFFHPFYNFLVDIDSTISIFGLRYDIALISNIDLDYPYFTLKQIYIPP